MRKLTLLFIGILLLLSCEKEEKAFNLALCDDVYFYYVGDSKINLKHSLNEIWIAFTQTDITVSEAKSILQKYSFLDVDNLPVNTRSDGLRVRVKGKNSCTDYKNHLKELNTDNDISSATPVFYTSDNDPGSYWILLSEIIAKREEDIISESDFIAYAETINLELIKSGNSSHHFKVKKW